MTLASAHTGAASPRSANYILQINELMKGSADLDPYPIFQKLRRDCPVQPGNVAVDHLGARSVGRRGDGRPEFSILGYDEAVQALSDSDTFSSSINADNLSDLMGKNILMLDGKEHRRHRNIVMPFLTVKRIKYWNEEVFRPLVQREFLDPIRAKGPKADLMSDLCLFFPVSFIYGLLGLPEEQREAFHTCAIQILSGGTNPEAAMKASIALQDMLVPLIRSRMAKPENDLISEVLHTTSSEIPFTEEEALGFLRLLLPAGAETTTRSSGNALAGLLTHPDQLDAARRNRSLIPAVINEALRWEAPVVNIFRTATRDTELAGVKIPKGAIVHVFIGAANRDERRFENPDEFKIDRDFKKAGLAFGWGPHLCVGKNLALMEIETVLNMIFDQLPGLRLDADFPPPRITGINMRSPAALPVVFDL